METAQFHNQAPCLSHPAHFHTRLAPREAKGPQIPEHQVVVGAPGHQRVPLGRERAPERGRVAADGGGVQLEGGVRDLCGYGCVWSVRG